MMSRRRSVRYTRLRNIVLVCSIFVVASEACDDDEMKFGADCDLTCHCKDAAPCDADGKCLNSSVCQTSWSGPTCQIQLENVALGKAAEGEPLKNSNNSVDKAIDGDFTSYTWLQNSDNTTVYWQVDLGQVYSIHTINIAFYDPVTISDKVKIEKRRPGFSLRIKQSPEEDGEICFKDESIGIAPAANQSFTNCTFEGQYIYLENSRKETLPIKEWSSLPNLEINEVEVFVDSGCSNGTYGKQCEEQCGHCIDQQCDRQTGSCQGICENGYYGDKCDTACLAACLKCLETGSCDSCQDTSTHGDYCNETCPTGCANECFQNGTCVNECEVGFYGELCDKSCLACHVNDSCPCDRMDGKCLCGCSVMSSYGMYCNVTCSSIHDNCVECTGSSEKGVCLLCNSSRYGDQCENLCPENCSKCLQDDGRCLQCSNGNFGSLCELKCGNCLDSICNITTGECPDMCIDGYHGKFCNLTCTICEGNKCDKLSGNCSSCPAGHYGGLCEYNCSDSCLTTCHQYTADCIDCPNRKYGPQCTESCDNCDSCNQTGYCSYCRPNFYGDYCNMSCPVNCGRDPSVKHSQIECSKQNGMCIFCKSGYYTNNCTKQCSSNCMKDSGFMCEMSSGKCRDCIPGYWGWHCQDVCSENCAWDKERSRSRGSCDQWSGVCIHGCVNGWHHDDCSRPCNITCNQGLCDRATAACQGCVDGYEGVFCEQKKPEEGLSIILIAVIGIAVVLLAVVLTAILCFCLRMRIKRNKRNEDGIVLPTVRKGPKREIDRNSIVYTNLNGNSQNPPVPERNFVPSDGMAIGTGESVPLMYQPASDPADEPESATYYNLDSQILVSAFTENLQNRQAKSAIWYKDEFAKLPKGLLKSCSIAKSPENKGKCRYQMLYPYDDNRVILEPETNASSDFINASYVNGYKKPQAFIASQGPIDVNLNDFWRMIFQQDCGKIVMLTKLYEECKLKCVCYWPEMGEKEEYGNYTVTTVSETAYPDYVLRQLEVENVETREAKEFKQFHFMSWPDCGVPESPSSMLHFRNKVMEEDSTLPQGPILVHCSAGIGRTGTFIALDYLLRQAQEEKLIDVFRTITDMRFQRTNFIQTDIQYEYLHRAISEALITTSMDVSLHEFPAYYQSLLDVDDSTGKTKLQEQYELLNKMSPKIDPSVCMAGNLEENKTKNRYSTILPVDTYRAYLSTPVKGSNEYINAVFLPTCSSKTGFLLTQMPLPQTVTDFWRLVYDQHVTHVVMMNNLADDDDDDDNVGEYWPSDDCTYGPFKIELLSCDNNLEFSIMNMQLTYTSSSRPKQMMVRQFRYEGWPENHSVPPDTKAFIEFISEVSKSYRTSADQIDEPIISHCMDGVERSGLLCVLSVIMERLKSDQRLNIPQIILQLRGRRPQLITSLDQFNFCYSAVSNYLNDLEASQIYSNVL